MDAQNVLSSDHSLLESRLPEQENDHEDSEHSDAPNIQLQLLQVLKTVSSSQDLSVLQEVMDTLNSALGGETVQVTRHRLDSIKEEEEAEGDLSPQAAETREEPNVSGKGSNSGKIKEVQNKLFSIQDYLECVGKLQDHTDVLDEMKKELCSPMAENMEGLLAQLEECESLKLQLSDLAEVLTEDTKKAKELLCFAAVEVPQQIYQDLASTYLDLEPHFTAVCNMCAEKSVSLQDAMKAGKEHLETTYVQHLHNLQELSELCQNNSELPNMDLNSCDVDTLTCLIQKNEDFENCLLMDGQLKLEDATFEIQSFISEYSQFLSPAHSSYLLKLLSSTQRAFREHTNRLAAERSSLESLVEQKHKENQAQVYQYTMNLSLWFTNKIIKYPPNSHAAHSSSHY